MAAQAEAVRRTTAPAPDRAAARPGPGTTAALVQACSNHRRVGAVEALDDTFTAPADLDPVAVLEEHLALGWEYDVEVVVP